MTEDQHDLLVKAQDSIKAARVLLSEGFPGFAVSRAYYAMFYIAQTFLEGEGLSFSKHSAVIAAFGEHFARTGRVPAQFHRFLLEAMELRHESDYAPRRTISDSQAVEQIDRAESFLELGNSLIGPASDGLTDH
jgi:uncharacterized protein (UPF0332 family)